MSPSRSRVTMADVAELAGVTSTTVSRVLNNKGEISAETRQKVLDAVAKLGYRRSRIAQSLATDRTCLLGLIVPSVSSEFFSEIARGAEDAAWENDYKILLCNTEGDWDREEGMFLFLQDLQVDGIVDCSPRLPEDRLLPLVQQSQNVVVVNGQGISWHGLAGVIETNDAEGMAQMAAHLVESGRRQLVYLGGPPNARTNFERYRGFRNALDAHGLAPVFSEYFECRPANLSGGRDAFKHIIAQYPQIDGVLCWNDEIAVGAIQVCAELGIRVPEDVAIVGCDDHILASVIKPGLTTLHTPKQTIGALAVKMLLERINGKRDYGVVTINQALIVRGSAP